MADKDALKPCPFCGSPAEIEDHSITECGTPGYSPGCTNSECIVYQTFDGFARKIEATEAWNTRALSAPPPAVAPQGWQSIETAPRGPILLFVGVPVPGKWNGHGWDLLHPILNAQGFDTMNGRFKNEPTHWMPLPKAPQ